MQNIIIGKWKIEYDKNKTVEAYNKCEIKGCDCQSSKNYYFASEYFTDGVKTLFTNIGIDIKKPIEIYNKGIYKNGKLLYGGYYYIVGKIIKGKDVWKRTHTSIDGGITFFQQQRKMHKISDDFEIGFTYHVSMLNNNFPENICEIDISFWVPWVLEDKDYIKNFL